MALTDKYYNSMYNKQNNFVINHKQGNFKCLVCNKTYKLNYLEKHTEAKIHYKNYTKPLLDTFKEKGIVDIIIEYKHQLEYEENNSIRKIFFCMTKCLDNIRVYNIFKPVYMFNKKENLLICMRKYRKESWLINNIVISIINIKEYKNEVKIIETKDTFECYCQ